MRRTHAGQLGREVRAMTGIARLEMGQLGSDGRRAYTAVDSAGGRWQGVLDEPELVEDYLGYLDSLGRKRPVITGPKPAAINRAGTFGDGRRRRHPLAGGAGCARS